MSCNFLIPRAADLKKSSDTLSEISETGTATSGWTSGWGSREELRDFVTKIGLKDVSDLYQDRFRVDRKKLEQMLSGKPCLISGMATNILLLIFMIHYFTLLYLGDNEAPLPADIFFEQV